MGIRYSSLPGHTMELTDALKEILSDKWNGTRGIEIVSIAISSIRASEKDEEYIKELQRSAVFRNPTMAAAYLSGAQGAAMQSAAKNENAGASMAFMGMGMAGNMGGMNAQNLYQMGQQQQNSQHMESAGQPSMAGQPIHLHRKLHLLHALISSDSSWSASFPSFFNLRIAISARSIRQTNLSSLPAKISLWSFRY